MIIRERILIRGSENIPSVPKDINKTFLSGQKIGRSIRIIFLMDKLEYDESLEFKVFNILDEVDPSDKFLFAFEDQGHEFFLFVGKRVDNCP